MLERELQHLDLLVNALAARASDVSGLTADRLTAKLLHVFHEAKNHPLTFDYLTTFSESEASPRDQISRKIAWIMQHSLMAKAWNVNTKLFTEHDGVDTNCPIVEQLRLIGISFAADRWRDRRDEFMRLNRAYQTTLDATLVSHDRKTIYVVKGSAISSLNARPIMNRRLAPAGSVGPTLWQEDATRLMGNVLVPSKALSTLILATAIVKDTFPHVNVIPLYCVVDDFDAGWHFESYDLSDSYLQHLGPASTKLDVYPVFDSSLRHLEAMEKNSDHFSQLPDWATSAAFDALPPDRPARCLMCLEILEDSQAGNDREVLPVSGSALAREVERRFLFKYPKDMRRHDLLHLERMRMIEKHPGTRFSIAPYGIARFFVTLAMAYGKTVPDFAETVLKKVVKQAELEWHARSL